jgi:hypothetical protein
MRIDVDGFRSSRGQVSFEDVLGSGHPDLDALLVVTFDSTIALASSPKVYVLMAKFLLEKLLKFIEF